LYFPCDQLATPAGFFDVKQVKAMAVLSETDRQRVWRGVMRWWSNSRDQISVSKADIRAAVDSTDDWQDTHGGNTTADNVGYNGALPTAFKNNATVAQKTLLFCAVAAVRVSVAFARSMFGELD
jgi:hypothetical protein